MPATGEQYLRPDVIRKVQRLDLKARFIVEGFLTGLHNSPYHGFSVEFSEHRKYVSGDDIRLIDWGVWARTDRHYVRKYRAETNLDAYLLVDCSASMGYSSDGRMTKLDYAICLAAALGHMMIHQQDSVGLVTFGERVLSFLPPKSKRSHLTHLLSVLASTRPEGVTNLADALNEVANRVRKRGLMIVISDLLSDPEAVVRALHHLRFRGHDLIVFQVLDHSELTLDFDSPTRFEDPESRDHVDADPRAIRSAYREELEAFIDDYRRECRNVRADFVTVDNSMTFDKALVEFLVERKSRF
jgi:uncharacterized protein (DUF58 family)